MKRLQYSSAKVTKILWKDALTVFKEFIQAIQETDLEIVKDLLCTNFTPF